eukprot:3064071-Prorocentrum_lima.AAC.1
MSRADIAPFIGHLQRHAHEPHFKHLKVLIGVLRFCKRVNTGLLYKKLVAPVRMVFFFPPADALTRSMKT